MAKIICYTGIVLMVLSTIGLIGAMYADIWELVNGDIMKKLYASFTASICIGFFMMLFTAPHILKY